MTPELPPPPPALVKLTETPVQDNPATLILIGGLAASIIAKGTKN